MPLSRLVLSRMHGESITIGTGPDAIVITVDLRDRNRIKLSIEAPREVLVMRTELLSKAKPGEAA